MSASSQSTPAKPSKVVPLGTPGGIDPRAPRFGAAITSALLLLGTLLALLGVSTRTTGSGFAIGQASFGERIADGGFIVLLIVAIFFVWSLASPSTHPFGLLFRTAVRPRLAPPKDLEDPRPPQFSQLVGLIVVGIGLVLHLLAVPWALPVAGAFAFIAAFLNASIGFCLGCEIYLLLVRAGLIGYKPLSAAAA